jgi:hypothetical protein
MPLQMKPQPGESPLANFGRYGLYRSLLRSQVPRLEQPDPLAEAALLQNRKSRL